MDIGSHRALAQREAERVCQWGLLLGAPIVLTAFVLHGCTGSGLRWSEWRRWVHLPFSAMYFQLFPAAFSTA